jgi:putative membrane protein
VRRKLYLLGLFLVFAGFWVWAAARPVYREDWLLENYLVFIGVPLILLLGRWFRLSLISYTLLTVFMVLHVIGSHYTYAEVPFGYTLQHWFGAQRNMYDRLVHFCFGFLVAYPVREVFVRISRARGFWNYYLPIELTLAFSAIYEIIEWIAAVTSGSEAGLAFLGAQGDIWDAQKDMLMAGLGAVLAMVITFAVAVVVEPDTWAVVRESLKIPAGDRPIGEDQIADWWRRRQGR